MELSSYISESLKQIITGVKNAQQFAIENEAIINGENFRINLAQANRPSIVDSGVESIVEIIEFDIAITTQESDGAKGGIGVFVGSLGIGTQGESSAQSTSQNKIRFSIPIVFPKQKQTTSLQKTSRKSDPWSTK